ncbi:MAG: MMPL family transporter [Bdellovibrio sp.]|nr:MMPL family transporter [Bdellovibrio sp.]
MITFIGAVLAAVGLYFSVLLYKNLRTDIEELLPTTARSVRDLNEVAQRLKSLDNIVVLVFSKDVKASKKFVLDLTAELQSLKEVEKKDTLSLVEYRIDRELQFFQDRRALYIELDDLLQIRRYVEARISYEKDLYNPLNIFSEKDLPVPQLNYQKLQEKYKNKVAGYDRFPGGFYATSDEKVRAVVAYMPGKGLDKAQRLKNLLEKTVNRLNPSSYSKDLQVKYTGNAQNLIEESAALVEDLELSTIIVIVLVATAMLVFFRSFFATWALVWSAFFGTFWTFGISFFAVGYLNANTAFLASIVIGNGINFGIIFLARYLEDRRAQLSNAEAVYGAIQGTSGATLTAALAAALSYGSLMLTGFRGFSQFGVIGFIGMLTCWGSAYSVLPAFLTLLDRWGWLNPRPAPKPLISSFVAAWVEKMPRLIWGASILGVVLSFLALKNYKTEIIETDLTKLRDKRSMSQGSGALYHYIDDIFGHSFSPLVILPKDRQASRKIAAVFREEKEKEGKKSLITTVQTLDDFIPKLQEEKVRVIRDIQRLLPPRLVVLLPDQEKRHIKELLNPKSFHPFSEKDLPPLLLDKFREADGTAGKIVLVDKVIESGKDDASSLVKFVSLGRRLADSVAPNTPVAGDLPISFDMFQAITIDGPRATLFAFLAVVLLVIILFRNLKTSVLCLFALGLGVTWLAGLIFGFNLKINFLNFIALPITFGIGVDYGVNIFQRYRIEGPGSIIKVVRNTGGAVMLCSFTTIIGYSSLLIAGNQAFVSFGRLAVLGELTCIVAAVISLPAFLEIRRRKGV